MNTDEYFMQKALEEAQIAFEEDEIPVGAIITIDNRIIAKAHNLTERLKDVTAHAEMQAITMAAHYLGGKLHPKTEVVTGILSEEATTLLKQFFQQKRK